MAYEQTTYTTAVSAAQLNKGEAAIDDVEARATTLETTSVVGPAATGTDSAGLAAQIAATPSGGVLTLRAGASYVISGALTIAAPITIRVNGASIRQATWRQPVFDCGVTNDVTIEGPGLFSSTETRTSGAGSFRGDDEDRYGAGVWAAGNRITVRNLRVDGLDSGVHLTNWTTGSTHAGRPAGNVVENLRVSSVDFGVLCVSQDGPRIKGIRGSYARSTGSGDPAHLVYVTYYGTDNTRDLVGGDWQGADSTGDAPFLIKRLRGGALARLIARNCGGLFQFENVFDLTIDGLVGYDDQKADENGSIYAADNTSERVQINNAIVRKAVSGRAVRFVGIDCVIDGLHAQVNRTAGVGAEDIQLGGVRSKIRDLQHRNIGSITTGYEGVMVRSDAVDCAIIDPEIRGGTTQPGTRNCINISAGATGTMVEYDPVMLVAAATFVKISDLGTSSRLIDKIP